MIALGGDTSEKKQENKVSLGDEYSRASALPYGQRLMHFPKRKMHIARLIHKSDGSPSDCMKPSRGAGESIVPLMGMCIFRRKMHQTSIQLSDASDNLSTSRLSRRLCRAVRRSMLMGSKGFEPLHAGFCIRFREFWSLPRCQITPRPPVLLPDIYICLYILLTHLPLHGLELTNHHSLLRHGIL